MEIDKNIYTIESNGDFILTDSYFKKIVDVYLLAGGVGKRIVKPLKSKKVLISTKLTIPFFGEYLIDFPLKYAALRYFEKAHVVTREYKTLEQLVLHLEDMYKKNVEIIIHPKRKTMQYYLKYTKKEKEYSLWIFGDVIYPKSAFDEAIYKLKKVLVNNLEIDGVMVFFDNPPSKDGMKTKKGWEVVEEDGKVKKISSKLIPKTKFSYMYLLKNSSIDKIEDIVEEENSRDPYQGSMVQFFEKMLEEGMKIVYLPVNSVVGNVNYISNVEQAKELAKEFIGERNGAVEIVHPIDYLEDFIKKYIPLSENLSDEDRKEIANKIYSDIIYLVKLKLE